MGRNYSRPEQQAHEAVAVYGFTKEWGLREWIFFFKIRKKLRKAEKVEAVSARLRGNRNG